MTVDVSKIRVGDIITYRNGVVGTVQSVEYLPLSRGHDPLPWRVRGSRGLFWYNANGTDPDTPDWDWEILTHHHPAESIPEHEKRFKVGDVWEDRGGELVQIVALDRKTSTNAKIVGLIKVGLGNTDEVAVYRSPEELVRKHVPLWEGEVWYSGDELRLYRTYDDDSYMEGRGWRKIKVKEVR